MRCRFSFFLSWTAVLQKGTETWSVKNAFGQRINSLRSVLFFGQSKGFIKSFTFQPGNIAFRTNEDKKIPILEPKSDILLHVLDDDTKEPVDDKRVWAQLDTTTLNDVHVEGLAAYQDVTTIHKDARLYVWW